MTDYIYEATPVLDPVSGQLVRSATGQIYAISDTARTTPLSGRDSAGLVKTVFTAGPQGVLEAFVVVDQPQVVWVSGDYSLVVTSYTSLLQAAEDAAEAAATAAAAAATSATAAQDAQEAVYAGFPTDGFTVTVLWSGGSYPVQPSSAPTGARIRQFRGPQPYSGPTWEGVLDEWAYAALT